MERPIVSLDIDGVLNSKQWYAQDATRKEERNSQPSTDRGLMERSIDPACLVSMPARSFGTVKSRNRAPKLVAMTEIAGGEDAGDRF